MHIKLYIIYLKKPLEHNKGHSHSLLIQNSAYFPQYKTALLNKNSSAEHKNLLYMELIFPNPSSS